MTSKMTIKKAINEFAEKKGLSKNKLAEKLGVSAATLTNIEQEKWSRLTDSILLKIWNAVKKREDWNVITTANYQIIQHLCDITRGRHQMRAIIGETGTGKTTAMTDYYREHENTYYVRISKMMSAKQFLVLILKEMGINSNGSIYDLGERIAKEMNKQYAPLLIIDEAGRLNQKLMDYIHDMTDNNAGILLVGVNYFKEKVKTAAENEKEGMPEFYDRISSWTSLKSPTRQEIRLVCNANGIADKETIRQLSKASNFRKLTNYISNLLHQAVLSH